MAKTAYVGVGNTAKKISNIYVGVNGVPKKVIRGYVGVGGVPKLFWDGGAQVIPDSWDWWTTLPTTILGVHKTNRKIAYYASVKYNNDLYALLVSTNADAVAYDSYTSQGSVNRLGVPTWYYNMQGTTTDTTCLLNNAEYLNVTDAVNDLIDKILYLPFHEDYQVGQTYQATNGDGVKCFRKLMGYILWTRANRNDALYLNFSDNIDDIISHLGGAGDYYARVGDGSSSSSYIQIIQTGITLGRFTVASHSSSSSSEVYFTDAGFTDYGEAAYVSRSGISYGTTTTQITRDSIAIGIGTIAGGDWRSSSFCLDL